MALARYRDSFWFPNGILAVNTVARVFPLTSSALAPLFTDVTGTTPLPNPLTTNGSGVLEFWAEEGEYWVHIDTASFRVQVGSPDSDVFEIAASSISTGIVWGGNLTVNAGNPGAVDIAPLVGYVVDHTTDPVRPSVVRVDYSGATVALDGPALTRALTWWLLSANGTVTQQATRPTNVQWRTHIVLGATLQSAGSIFIITPLPNRLAQTLNQLGDLMESLGPFNATGNAVSANGVNRMINKTAGELFLRASNHSVGGVLTNNPHVFSTPAQTPAQFQYATRTTTALGGPVSLIDAANFDVGGVVTPVGGGSNTSTVQRIFMVTAPTAPQQILIQYGQSAFGSLSTAVNSIGSGAFTVNPSLRGSAALIAYLAVVRTATNLSDPTQAVFVTAGKFDTP